MPDLPAGLDLGHATAQCLKRTPGAHYPSIPIHRIRAADALSETSQLKTAEYAIATVVLLPLGHNLAYQSKSQYYQSQVLIAKKIKASKSLNEAASWEGRALQQGLQAECKSECKPSSYVALACQVVLFLTAIR